MNSQQLTFKDYFKSIQVIHFALMTGVLFFAVIAYILVSQGFAVGGLENIDNLLSAFVPVFLIAGLFSGNFLFKIKVNEAKEKPGLMEKFNLYRSALIIKLALVEGPAFFSIVFYMLTGKFLYLVLTGFLLAVFYYYKPTREKIIGDLELSSAERQIVEDPDGVIG